MMLSWKTAACLAAGNTVVIKPAQVSAHSVDQAVSHEGNGEPTVRRQRSVCPHHTLMSLTMRETHEEDAS